MHRVAQPRPDDFDSRTNPDTDHLRNDEFESIEKWRKGNLRRCVCVPYNRHALALGPAESLQFEAVPYPFTNLSISSSFRQKSASRSSRRAFGPSESAFSG